MKTLLTLSTLGLITLSASIFASDWSTSSSATLASQYIFRGVDANNKSGALQADYNVEHTSGFSAGVWGSDYADGVEIDIFASYGFKVNEDFSLSVGFTEYTYSGYGSGSSFEYSVGASWKNFGLTYFDDTDLEASYISLDGEFPIDEKTNFVAHIGNVDPDAVGSNSTTDYSVGISRAYNDDISFSLNYTATSNGGSARNEQNLWGGITISL